MPYDEEDLLPISAIQHLAFCPRRCALIHLDRVWEENRLTAEGRQLHERTHQLGQELRTGVLTVRALPLRSIGLGITGQADMVEFHRTPGDQPPGICLAGRNGLWRPVPVEYKRGKPQADHTYALQLCCQALCLEEMLGIEIPRGQIFYGSDRRRVDVHFTPELRARAQALAVELHQLMDAKTIPPAVFSPKCHSCSLVEHCLPGVVTGRKSVVEYMAAAFKQAAKEGGGP